MDFGDIIKRSWRITWRYKALWVLGIFAGVSGCTGGGSSGGGGGTGRGGGGDGTPGFSYDSGWDSDFRMILERMQELMPLIVGGAVVLMFLGVLWSVLQIAARGGLVTGVDGVERDGTAAPLGVLWKAGFGRFWTLVGLDLLLKFPLFVVGAVMLLVLFVPLLGTLMAGQEPGTELILPVCGSLIIGVPILAIGGLVLGIMYLIALRYVMLGGQGAVQAAGNSWRFLRARMKDTILMYLLNAALNIASSLVLVIPAIVVGIAVAVPFAAAIATEEWGALMGLVPLAIVLFMLLGLVYNAIWGTYTSALWTLFFRSVSGMDAAPAMPVPAEPSPTPAAYAPAPAPPVSPESRGDVSDG